MSSEPGNTTSSTTTGFVIVGLLIACAAGSIPLLRAERNSLERESVALRSEQSSAVSVTDSLRVTLASLQATLQLERARATARTEPKLHLVVAVDSGTVALVRDGITLRSMPARFRGGAPARGTQAIAKIAESVVAATPPTVDSLGVTVKVALPETKVERVTFSDGTTLEGGDAADAMLGGVDVAPGPRVILVSRRDFAAIRPNLVRGMKAVLF
jgi:hypothetical protein